MNLPRPDDLEEFDLSVEPDTLIIIIKPNQWNTALAEAYNQGVLLLELVDDVRGRQMIGRAFLNPDPITDDEEEEAAAKKKAAAKPKAKTTEA